MKLKPKFRGRRPSISFSSTKKSNGKKKRSNDDRAMGEDSDEDEYCDDMYSDVSEEEEDDAENKGNEEDSFFHKQSKKRFSLERTWSVNAFNVSSHSAGVVYLDESEGDSETDSSYDGFGSDGNDDLYVTDDEEEDNSTAKITNETKSHNIGRKSSERNTQGSGTKTSELPISTRRSSTQFKKEMKLCNDSTGIIPECDEDEEMEDITNDDDDDDVSDDDSVLYHPPFTMRRPPSISELMAYETENVDSGYSSDSALVKKRMEMLHRQHEDSRRKEGLEPSSNDGKNKKESKKKASSKKVKKKVNKNRNNLEKDNSARSGGGSLEGDSTVTTISVESEEEVRQSPEMKAEKNVKKKKKKKEKEKEKKKDEDKKKKKPSKDGKKKKKRAVISFLVDGDDEACADFDKRLEEIEQFEASLVEERKLIQRERETMAFERESMEMRLDEEAQECDELNLRIKELEHLVQSQQISNAGNVVESIDEKNGLKLDFAREKREFHLQLVEKEREIEDLKCTVRDLKTLQGTGSNRENDSFDSNSLADGKSRERLQGELLQTVAKLSQKEALLISQGEELELTREEVVALKLGKETSELNKILAISQEENKNLQEEIENERKENYAKLKDKDETVTFLMNELARLKKDQSILSKGR